MDDVPLLPPVAVGQVWQCLKQCYRARIVRLFNDNGRTLFECQMKETNGATGHLNNGGGWNGSTVLHRPGTWGQMYIIQHDGFPLCLVRLLYDATQPQ